MGEAAAQATNGKTLWLTPEENEQPDRAALLMPGKHSFIEMTDNSDRDWRYPHHYAGQLPMLTSQWSQEPTHHIGGMAGVDLGMFQHEPSPFAESYRTTVVSEVPPPYESFYAGHHPHTDTEMLTPSTSGFPTEITEGYLPAHSQAAYLQPPVGLGHGSVATESPRSAHEDISPRQQPKTIARHQQSRIQRPTLSRSITAPEATASIKRSGSEEDEDDYVPVEEVKGRGRKRQRIPHTAVERRYRENLNAHLDKLRQSVPLLASRGGKGADAQEGIKPSKCEILNGAIEHIAELGKEKRLLKDHNRMLKEENEMLKARLEELHGWNHGHSNTRGSAFGA
ncbi:hypothetical protein LTR86_000362 [Recurvomyces mirabilis]|nr:hypothetical protein LTR86_000362 [Recurvomyces mirabilis]